MAKQFLLTPGKIDLALLQQAKKHKMRCILDTECKSAVEASCVIVQQILKDKKTVYGINTGFGALAHQLIPKKALKQLQHNLVLSHACGTGPLLADEIVAMMLLLKINNLAQGYSGVRMEVIEALCALYNTRVFPCVPAQGSVGASGDLAPLAHLVLPLLGIGEVRYKGKIISAEKGLAIAGIAPVVLEAKEGLALLNGLQASTAICVDAFFSSEILFETALLAGSLSVDAALGSDVPFDERIQAVRGHQAQADVAAIYRALLTGSAIRESHHTCSRVQDPYSLRCQPQIMGAVLHQMRFVRDTLQVEVNAVSDNPLIFVDHAAVLSGGNFHGEIIAMAADNLALAIAEIGANAERRIALLIDKNFSGLPAFLVKESGLNSGFMIAHVTAAACASENKALATPRSVDSLPTSANQEDHVSMATGAALRLQSMLDNTATIIAIELLAACQGIEFQAPLKTSPLLQKTYHQVRDSVRAYEKDRYFAPDIALIKQKVLSGDFIH